MSNDAAAIKYLEDTLREQKEAFKKDMYPTLEERQSRLEALGNSLVKHRDDLRESLKADFGGHHPEGVTDVFECLGVAGRAKYVASQLAEWMKPRQAEVDPQLHGDGSAEIFRQPKGVVGVLIPFNFPIILSLGPLCEILGAGNRAILKPSEFTPATGKVLKKIVNEAFPHDLVEVVEGGVELGVKFSSMPWHHLLYTGSSPVGKLVMAAAAKNLVPVTLELGGKSPTIITKGGVTEESVAAIVNIKMLKSGQMCVTPDTTYIHKDEVDKFVELSKKFVTSMDFNNERDSTGLIHDRHYDRLVKMKEEAVSSGARVEDIEPAERADKATRRIPLSFVVDPKKGTAISEEEIFGPIMSIVTIDSVEEAVNAINESERPLGLYIYSSDEKEIDYVLKNTISGGACVNAAATQAAINSLGFGGVGNSGMGRHQGFEGYCEFSNPRGIFRRGKQAILPWGPPYRTFEAISQQVFGQ